MLKKKVLEVKGVKINIPKGRLILPTKALKMLKKNIKKKTVGEKDGTYILEDGITYARFGKKEICYRNAYIANDYLVVPLTVDKISNLELLSKDEIEVTQVVEEKEELIPEEVTVETVEENKDDKTFTYQLALEKCEETTLLDIETNGYFLYNDELYIKLKTGCGFSPRRLPDATLLSNIIDTKKVNMYDLKVTKLI